MSESDASVAREQSQYDSKISIEHPKKYYVYRQTSPMESLQQSILTFRGTPLPPKISALLKNDSTCTEFGSVSLQMPQIDILAQQQSLFSSKIFVRVRWWGEDPPGQLFRPVCRITNTHDTLVPNDQMGAHYEDRLLQQHWSIEYPIIVQKAQFFAYLSDMHELVADVIDSKTRRLIGIARIALDSMMIDDVGKTIENKCFTIMSTQEANENVVLGYIYINLQIRWTASSASSNFDKDLQAFGEELLENDSLERSDASDIRKELNKSSSEPLNKILEKGYQRKLQSLLMKGKKLRESMEIALHPTASLSLIPKMPGSEPLEDPIFDSPFHTDSEEKIARDVAFQVSLAKYQAMTENPTTDTSKFIGKVSGTCSCLVQFVHIELDAHFVRHLVSPELLSGKQLKIVHMQSRNTQLLLSVTMSCASGSSQERPRQSVEIAHFTVKCSPKELLRQEKVIWRSSTKTAVESLNITDSISCTEPIVCSISMKFCSTRLAKQRSSPSDNNLLPGLKLVGEFTMQANSPIQTHVALRMCKPPNNTRLQQARHLTRLYETASSIVGALCIKILTDVKPNRSPKPKLHEWPDSSDMSSGLSEISDAASNCSKNAIDESKILQIVLDDVDLDCAQLSLLKFINFDDDCCEACIEINCALPMSWMPVDLVNDRYDTQAAPRRPSNLLPCTLFSCKNGKNSKILQLEASKLLSKTRACYFFPVKEALKAVKYFVIVEVWAFPISEDTRKELLGIVKIPLSVLSASFLAPLDALPILPGLGTWPIVHLLSEKTLGHVHLHMRFGAREQILKVIQAQPGIRKLQKLYRNFQIAKKAKDQGSKTQSHQNLFKVHIREPCGSKIPRRAGINESNGCEINASMILESSSQCKKVYYFCMWWDRDDHSRNGMFASNLGVELNASTLPISFHWDAYTHAQLDFSLILISNGRSMRLGSAKLNLLQLMDAQISSDPNALDVSRSVYQVDLPIEWEEDAETSIWKPLCVLPLQICTSDSFNTNRSDVENLHRKLATTGQLPDSFDASPDKTKASKRQLAAASLQLLVSIQFITEIDSLVKYAQLHSASGKNLTIASIDKEDLQFQFEYSLCLGRILHETTRIFLEKGAVMDTFDTKRARPRLRFDAYTLLWWLHISSPFRALAFIKSARDEAIDRQLIDMSVHREWIQLLQAPSRMTDSAAASLNVAIRMHSYDHPRLIEVGKVCVPLSALLYHHKGLEGAFPIQIYANATDCAQYTSSALNIRCCFLFPEQMRVEDALTENGSELPRDHFIEPEKFRLQVTLHEARHLQSDESKARTHILLSKICVSWAPSSSQFQEFIQLPSIGLLTKCAASNHQLSYSKSIELPWTCISKHADRKSTRNMCEKEWRSVLSKHAVVLDLYYEEQDSETGDRQLGTATVELILLSRSQCDHIDGWYHIQDSLTQQTCGQCRVEISFLSDKTCSTLDTIAQNVPLSLEDIPSDANLSVHDRGVATKTDMESVQATAIEIQEWLAKLSLALTSCQSVSPMRCSSHTNVSDYVGTLEVEAAQPFLLQKSYNKDERDEAEPCVEASAIKSLSRDHFCAVPSRNLTLDRQKLEFLMRHLQTLCVPRSISSDWRIEMINWMRHCVVEAPVIRQIEHVVKEGTSDALSPTVDRREILKLWDYTTRLDSEISSEKSTKGSILPQANAMHHDTSEKIRTDWNDDKVEDQVRWADPFEYIDPAESDERLANVSSMQRDELPCLEDPADEHVKIRLSSRPPKAPIMNRSIPPCKVLLAAFDRSAQSTIQHDPSPHDTSDARYPTSIVLCEASEQTSSAFSPKKELSELQGLPFSPSIKMNQIELVSSRTSQTRYEDANLADEQCIKGIADKIEEDASNVIISVDPPTSIIEFRDAAIQCDMSDESSSRTFPRQIASLPNNDMISTMPSASSSFVKDTIDEHSDPDLAQTRCNDKEDKVAAQSESKPLSSLGEATLSSLVERLDQMVHLLQDLHQMYQKDMNSVLSTAMRTNDSRKKTLDAHKEVICADLEETEKNEEEAMDPIRHDNVPANIESEAMQIESPDNCRHSNDGIALLEESASEKQPLVKKIKFVEDAKDVQQLSEPLRDACDPELIQNTYKSSYTGHDQNSLLTSSTQNYTMEMAAAYASKITGPTRYKFFESETERIARIMNVNLDAWLEEYDEVDMNSFY